MPLHMECPECDEQKGFEPDAAPTEDDLTEEAKDIPRMNLKCPDCGHKVRLWDTGITGLLNSN